MMLRLSFRHLLRHWHLNLITLFGVLLGVVLAAAMPYYTEVVADMTIQRAIQESTVAERNILLNGDIAPETVESIEEALGNFILDRRHFGLTRVPALQRIYRPDGTIDETNFSDFFLNLWSVDPFESEVILVEGRWPSDTIKSDGTTDRPLIEVAVGSTVHETVDIDIGDRIKVGWPPVEVEIVGLVEPRDPESDIWFGESTLQRFQASRFSGSVSNTNAIYIGMLMPLSLFESQISENTEWRFLLDHQMIDAGNLADIYSSLLAFQAQEGSSKEKFETGLIDRIGQIRADRAQAQAGLYLLLIQSLLAILYTIALFTQFDLDRTQLTFGTLKGRGFNRAQLTQIVALNSGGLFFGVALPLGILIAYLAVRTWNPSDKDLYFSGMPNASWGLAIGVVLFCWLTVIISAYTRTRSNLLDWMRQRARPLESSNKMRRIIFELFVLVAGGLAYWQLRSSTGLLTADSANRFLGAGDPILLLAPTLVLFAIGLLMLRLMPLMISGISQLAERSRSFLVPVSLKRLARDTRTSTRIVLLITFTVALALFSTVMNGSLIQRQNELAHYETGADLRVRLDLAKTVAQTESEMLRTPPSVSAVSQVVRGDFFILSDGGSSDLVGQFLAVDPATLPDVSFYPPDLSPFTLETVVSILETGEEGFLPIVIGSNSQTAQIKRGDRFVINIGRSKIDVEVVGVIGVFPTLDRNYLVTNLALLDTFTDIEDRTLANEHVRELWLDVKPGEHQAVLAQAEALPTDRYPARILGDAAALAEVYKQGLIARETSAALQLNTIVLIVLSGVGFLTIQYFAAQQRFAELGVMQALGVDRKSWFRLISTEAFVILIIGAVLGGILGTALSLMMQPLFKLLLASSVGRDTTLELIFSPFNIAMMFGTLLVVYIGSIMILRWLLGRSEFQKQLRLVQE